ncbi:MAG: hypothetical protein ACFFDN_17105 [Candidatus Hodarchaeota archaeon]
MLTTSYRAEWNVIASRIEGLVSTGEFFYRSLDRYLRKFSPPLNKIK